MRTYKDLVKLVYTGILLSLLSPSLMAASGEKKTITGEVMDTWCYTSQIMGASDFVIGTSHHTCAVWCAAGGIPVGLLDQADGTVYMIMSLGQDTDSVANSGLLDIQSHVITVEGTPTTLTASTTS